MLTSLLSLFSVTNGCKPPAFFGLKPWYQYLETNSDCSVTHFTVLEGGRSDFLLIGLAIIDDMLRIGGLIAIGYIIYGGILYITSQGSPDGTSKAQSSIQNALIGLIIIIIAVSLVSFSGNRLS